MYINITHTLKHRKFHEYWNVGWFASTMENSSIWSLHAAYEGSLCWLPSNLESGKCHQRWRRISAIGWMALSASFRKLCHSKPFTTGRYWSWNPSCLAPRHLRLCLLRPYASQWFNSPSKPNGWERLWLRDGASCRSSRYFAHRYECGCELSGWNQTPGICGSPVACFTVFIRHAG